MSEERFTNEQELIIRLFLGLTWILDKYSSETNQDKDLTSSHLIIQVMLVVRKLSIKDKKEALQDAFKILDMFDEAFLLARESEIIRQKQEIEE